MVLAHHPQHRHTPFRRSSGIQQHHGTSTIFHAPSPPTVAIRTPEEQEAYNQAARKMVEYEAKLDDCIVRDQVKRAQIRTSILIDMTPMPPRRERR
ncbi:hypothetical protein CAEBREN_08833 [Caenorhabditis brenneri]|uniref:Uncharacterized protein n=1 Tax=Caenorhabditis brenneri TaxID=135651 RepID=G0NV40_CAEBE|nr:hypothetical protein CAEBREN_08833 [Caenorhabditis brenneri]